MFFVLGPECGDNADKVYKLVRALYGLKYSGAARRTLFSHFIQ